MAILTIIDQSSTNFWLDSLDWSVASISSTQVLLKNLDGTLTEINGFNFTFDGSGMLDGGTMTSLRHLDANDPNIVLATLNQPASPPSFASFISNFPNVGDILLAGNDTINGSGTGDAAPGLTDLWGFGGNDTYNVYIDQVAHAAGGNDTINGLANLSGSLPPGEFYELQGVSYLYQSDGSLNFQGMAITIGTFNEFDPEQFWNGTAINVEAFNNSAALTETDQLFSINNVTGSMGDDIIVMYAYGGVVIGEARSGTAYGEGGDDIIIGAYEAHGGSGDDVIVLTDSAESFTAVTNGTASNTQEDTWIAGMAYGGDDNDTIHVWVQGNVASSPGTDFYTVTVHGGAGNDTLSFEFPGNFDGVNLVGAWPKVKTTLIDLLDPSISSAIHTSGAITAFVFSGLENVTGSDAGPFDPTLFGVDVLYGTNEGNIMRGLGGNDFIDGRGGDDLIMGGEDDDELIGGAGIDTISYEELAGFGAGVTVDLAITTQQDTISHGLDTLSGFENLIGSERFDTLFGDAANNVISGLGNNDTINGRGGNDTLDGGEDDDTLNGGSGNDILIGGLGADDLDGGADTDTADYSSSNQAVTVSLDTGMGTGGHAQGDTLTNIENLNGSTHGDHLTGNSMSNVINAAGGNDTIFASLGFDTIDGGIGVDTFDLTNSTGVATNWVNLEVATAQYRVDSGMGFASRGSLTNIENVRDSAGNDRFFGDGDENTYFYSAGLDTVDGNGGFDTLDISAMTRGFQWIDLQASSSQLRSNDGNGWIANAVISDVERFVTTDDTDHFRGDAGDQTVQYRGGRDFINGREGSDRIDFSEYDNGNWVNLNIAFDQFRFFNGAGFQSGGNAQNIEEVTGGDGNDFFFADAEDNFYFGGLGNDRFDAGAGTDTFEVDGTLADYTLAGSGSTFTLSGLSGTDTLIDVEQVQIGDTVYNINDLNALI